MFLAKQHAATPNPGRLEAVMSRGVSPCPYAHLSDAQLDAHIEVFEAYLQVDEAELADAVAERMRRGRGGYELTPAAEAYLASRGADEARASAEIHASLRDVA
jgi:hypothetical protein